MGSGPCNHISWKQQEASQDAVTIWLLKQDPSNANASKHANLMWRGEVLWDSTSDKELLATYC